MSSGASVNRTEWHVIVYHMTVYHMVGWHATTPRGSVVLFFRGEKRVGPRYFE